MNYYKGELITFIAFITGNEIKDTTHWILEDLAFLTAIIVGLITIIKACKNINKKCYDKTAANKRDISKTPDNGETTPAGTSNNKTTDPAATPGNKTTHNTQTNDHR